MPILLERRLDCAGEDLGTPLVPPAARLNPGVDQNLGLRLYPGLTVALLPVGTGVGSPELGKHDVCLVRGLCILHVMVQRVNPGVGTT